MITSCHFCQSQSISDKKDPVARTSPHTFIEITKDNSRLSTNTATRIQGNKRVILANSMSTLGSTLEVTGFSNKTTAKERLYIIREMLGVQMGKTNCRLDWVLSAIRNLIQLDSNIFQFVTKFEMTEFYNLMIETDESIKEINCKRESDRCDLLSSYASVDGTTKHIHFAVKQFPNWQGTRHKKITSSHSPDTIYQFSAALALERNGKLYWVYVADSKICDIEFVRHVRLESVVFTNDYVFFIQKYLTENHVIAINLDNQIIAELNTGNMEIEDFERITLSEQGNSLLFINGNEKVIHSASVDILDTEFSKLRFK